MHSGFRRIAAGLAAGAVAVAIGIATLAAPTSADTAVGVGAGVAVDDQYVEAGFEHVLESALDSQFIGVDVTVVRGRVILEGFATPGVHTAVLALVADMLQTSVPVPVAVGVATPALGLDLPFLQAGAGIEIPDLGGLLRLLGVVDRIQIIR